MGIKLSDWVIQFIAHVGVRHVFEVTGGGAMHLNDSLGANPDVEYICTLHEQAASMAAESYAKVTGGLGVCVVTSGPGGTNAITGVAGGWLDSTPMLVLSGQAKRADLKGTTGVRQMGVQEVDIVSMVSPITKYAVTVMEPADIRFHMEKALYLALTGRPGPVWIDLPLDVQGAMIDEQSLRGFELPKNEFQGGASRAEIVKAVRTTIDVLNAAERPVLLIGNGVRLSGSRTKMRRLIEELRLPVLTTWPAHDMVPDDHPLMVGRPGPLAPRGANFTLQNSDCLLSIGARLDLVVTGYSPKNFARAARKIMVDVDDAELRKMQGTVDVPICADAGEFIDEMLRQIDQVQKRDRSAWDRRWKDWQTRYPVVLPEHRNLAQGVSTYVLGEAIGEATKSDDVIVSGSSGAGIEIFCLAVKLKEGQRLFLTTALGAMGNGLPGLIGACIANEQRRRTIGVDGDGGLQLNIQELETARRLKLPIKLFVLNNDGYASIRTSQSRYFGRLAGADATSGVTLPPLRAVVEAYGLPYARIESDRGLIERIRGLLDAPGPVVVEVMTPREEPRGPSLSSMRRPDGSMVSKPLEDLWPFLSREEFLSNMIIPPVEE
jgi:acetolactate synthase I/II/III large subunit